MKTIIKLLAFASVAIASTSNATTIITAGATGPTFKTSAGTTLTAANTAITLGRLTTAGNLGTFTAFASGGSSSVAINDTLMGKIIGQASDNTTAANPFNDQSIVMRITSGSELGFFTATGWTYPANGGGTNDTLSISTSSITSALMGTVVTAGAGGDIRLVPESGTAMLGMLSVLGLVARRRRA